MKKLLTQDQYTFLEILAKDESLQNFYLTGGTALTEYYLHHRQSDDLDFFCEKPFETTMIESFIQKIQAHMQSANVRFTRIHDRRLFYIDLGERPELKTEFTQYPFPSLEQKQSFNGIHVDSLRDITANKISALLDRFEPKDYVDLYFLLKDRNLMDVCKDVETKFGIRISPIFLGTRLANAVRIEILPKMFVPLELEDLKTFFIEQARQLKPSVLEKE